MRWLRSLLPNLIVLGSLGALAVWGHETDWTFTRFVAHGAGDIDHSPAAGHSGKNDAHSAEHGTTNVTFGSQSELDATGIRLGSAIHRSMGEHVTAHGVVSYVQTQIAQLSARVPGTVWRVQKQLGDSVKRGEVLAVLDAADVGKAKSEYLQAMVKEELCAETLDRLTTAGNAVPVKQKREAESEVREARVHRFTTQQALVNLGLPIRFEELVSLSDAARAARMHFLGLPADIVQGLDLETTTANLIPIIAPFDGVVVRREIVTGEVVTPEHSQLVVADVRAMWIKLNVNKEDAFRLSLGQDVSFEADGVPGEVQTSISWISTEVDDKTRTVQVIAKVDNPLLVETGDLSGQRLLKANTFGIGRIRVRQSSTAVVVPSRAVQWDGRAHVVFVPKPDRSGSAADGKPVRSFEPCPVRPGTTADGFTEILEGLYCGDEIVVDGSHLLKSELARRVAGRSEGP